MIKRVFFGLKYSVVLGELYERYSKDIENCLCTLKDYGHGAIAEGIDIEMWITKKGKVVTAYQLLK